MKLSAVVVWFNPDEKCIENLSTYCSCAESIYVIDNSEIEILQKNQHTQSIRYFEALVFNKKLLTNNPNVFSLPFYNPQYMKYFENVNDVDFEWLKSKEKINYGYNNEFSSIHLAKMIKTDFEREGAGKMSWEGYAR